MVNYDVRALQLRILKILKMFDKVCRQHGLRYCLVGGSLIGAVRHKGFIPWDDDLDVSMPRPDYEKLIKHSKEWLPSPYELICAENDPCYPLPFAKIQDANSTLIERKHLYYLGGLYMDVFPYDAWPDNKLARWWQASKYAFLKQALYLIHRDPYKHGHGPDSWAPLLARKLFTLQGLQKGIRKVLTKYDYQQATLASSYTDGLKGVLPKRITDVYVPFEFEGETMQGISEYDQYLTHQYGKYMEVPPPEKRVQHGFYYLDLNTPYREYAKKEQTR